MPREAVKDLPHIGIGATIEEVVDYLGILHTALMEMQYSASEYEHLATTNYELGDFKKASLSDPDADRVVFWDDSADEFTFLTVNTGLAISGTDLNLSHLGLESLTDPGADRIFFWDDSETAAKWLAPDGTTVQISGTTLSVITGGIDHGGLTGLGDDDHPQYILHSLADAASDFLVASAADTIVKKTLAETGAILEGDIQHDNLQGITANEHIDWTNASAAFLTSGTLRAGPMTTTGGSLFRTVDNSQFYIGGGSGVTKGASLQFFGEDRATLAGHIYFVCGGGSINLADFNPVIEFAVRSNDGGYDQIAYFDKNRRLYLWDADDNTIRLVSWGADDTGGGGFKVLRVPN